MKPGTRCAYCLALPEPNYPLSLYVDNGGPYYACSDAKKCGTRKVSA